MIKLNGHIVPLDFINQHNSVELMPLDDAYSTCKCGDDIEAVGDFAVVFKTQAFRRHLFSEFRRYKKLHRVLIGGGLN